MTMPMNKLSPPFKHSGASMLLRKNASKLKLQHENRTFFKGATSFGIGGEASMAIGNHDSAIRSHLGIDGRSKMNVKGHDRSSRLISEKKKSLD